MKEKQPSLECCDKPMEIKAVWGEVGGWKICFQCKKCGKWIVKLIGRS